MKFQRISSISTLVVALLFGTAQALPEDPPKAHLRYRGERIQRAILAAQCWPGENGGMGCSEVTPLPWPNADEVKAGARLRVRLKWSKKPNKVLVDSYRSIGDDGKPEDAGKDTYSKLIPVKRDGETKAWDVRFRLHAVRHHYVKMHAFWSGGSAVYNSHVRTVE